MLGTSMFKRWTGLRTLVAVAIATVLMLVLSSAALAGTRVPGHEGRDGTVVGKYTSVYAYDAQGDWYWDLGDGRTQGSVGSVGELEQDTLTVCKYQVQYRGDFGADPFLDDGWIMNNINCSGHDDNGTYNYLIVHETDPRYTGNPDWDIWGTWEYKVLTESGKGNPVRPRTHVGN